MVLAAIERRYTVLASLALMLEYEAVLTRREHIHASGMSREGIRQFLDSMSAVLEPVVPTFQWRPILRDPDDDFVLEASINGGARVIVTLNHRDFSLIPDCFGIEILSPGEAFERVKRR